MPMNVMQYTDPLHTSGTDGTRGRGAPRGEPFGPAARIPSRPHELGRPPPAIGPADVPGAGAAVRDLRPEENPMSMRPQPIPARHDRERVGRVRHHAGCRARWLRLPGTAAAPDCLSIRDRHRPDSATPAATPARAPVLLVHGYAGTEHMWHPLRAALAGAGFDQVIALRYNTFRTDIHRVADWLVEQAHLHDHPAPCATGAPDRAQHGRPRRPRRGTGPRAGRPGPGPPSHWPPRITARRSPASRPARAPGRCSRDRSSCARWRHAATTDRPAGSTSRAKGTGWSPPDRRRRRPRWSGSGTRRVTARSPVTPTSSRIVDELIGVDDRTADQFSLAA